LICSAQSACEWIAICRTRPQRNRHTTTGDVPMARLGARSVISAMEWSNRLRHRKEASIMTDKEIQQAVLRELEWEPQVRSTEIGVAVKDGIVTLTGYVDSYTKRYRAE